MTPAELLNHVNQAQGTTDADLARRFGFSRPTISDWRHGKRPIPDEHALILADIAQIDRATVLANLRAHNPHQAPDVRDTWKEIARRLGASAVTLALLAAPNVAQWPSVLVMSSQPRRGWHRRSTARLWGWSAAHRSAFRSATQGAASAA